LKPEGQMMGLAIINAREAMRAIGIETSIST
jgi:hypothetical protein